MFPKLYAAAVVPVAIRTLPLAPFPVVVTVFTEPLVGFATNEPADDFQLAAPLPLCPSALDEYQATSPFRGTLLAAAAHAEVKLGFGLQPNTVPPLRIFFRYTVTPCISFVDSARFHVITSATPQSDGSLGP